MVLRLSNHENLRMNLSRGRRQIHGRHVSGKSGVGDCKPLSSMFVSSLLPARFPVFDCMGSPIVAVGPLAYTLKKKGAVLRVERSHYCELREAGPWLR